MPLPKLMQQVLGSLDRTRHQLRKEHYIGGIHDKIPLGLLVSAVNLHYVTQTLKGMKRKPDRQDDRDHRTRQMPAQQVRTPYDRKKIAVTTGKKIANSIELNSMIVQIPVPL